jgi:hypothetical protein
MDKFYLAAVCLIPIAFQADPDEKKEADATKPIKRVKEEFASIPTAQAMALFNGKSVVLVRYGEFTCDASLLSQVKNSVRCWQPKGEGKDRLRIMSWSPATQAWRHQDLETKPASMREIEAIVAGLR